MSDTDELMNKALELLHSLDGKYSVIEILVILNMALSLYQGSAIKNSINGTKEQDYGSFYR